MLPEETSAEPMHCAGVDLRSIYFEQEVLLGQDVWKEPHSIRGRSPEVCSRGMVSEGLMGLTHLLAPILSLAVDT